jgi:hypothetical protein
VVEGEPRSLRIAAIERPVALLGHVELRPEHEPQALEAAEPGLELGLGQRLRVRRPLELLECGELPLEQAGSDQAGVLEVALVVVDEGGGKSR